MSAERIRTTLVRACSTALVVSLLAGCGGDDQPARDLDIAGAEESDSSSPSDAAGGENDAPAPPPGIPSVSPPPAQGQKVRDDDSQAYVLNLPSGGAGAQVGQTFVDYLNVRLAGYNTGQLDLAGLASVAKGEPLESVQTRILELQQEDLRTVGDIWVDMADDDVSVKGRTAELEGICLRNASVDVDAAGRAVESPPASYVATGRAQRFGQDVWIIDQLSFESVPEC